MWAKDAEIGGGKKKKGRATSHGKRNAFKNECGASVRALVKIYGMSERMLALGHKAQQQIPLLAQMAAHEFHTHTHVRNTAGHKDPDSGKVRLETSDISCFVFLLNDLLRSPFYGSSR